MAAVCQPDAARPPKKEMAGGFGVEVKRLRVVFPRESLDLSSVKGCVAGGETLAGFQIFQIKHFPHAALIANGAAMPMQACYAE